MTYLKQTIQLHSWMTVRRDRKNMKTEWVKAADHGQYGTADRHNGYRDTKYMLMMISKMTRIYINQLNGWWQKEML
jgi:hypothetical protein